MEASLARYGFFWYNWEILELFIHFVTNLAAKSSFEVQSFSGCTKSLGTNNTNVLSRDWYLKLIFLVRFVSNFIEVARFNLN